MEDQDKKYHLEQIKYILLNPPETRYTPGSNIPLMQEQNSKLREHLANAKDFLLDVKLIQPYYEGYSRDKNRFMAYEDFQLPFDDCFFAFENYLGIKWINTQRTSDIIVDLAAVVIHKAATKGDMTLYDVALVFDEIINDGIVNGVRALSNQYILFTYTPHREGTGLPNVYHVKHYPCRNKAICMVDEDGMVKPSMEPMLKQTGKALICQEIINRDALVETLIHVVNKLYEVSVIDAHKNKPKFWYPLFQGDTPILDSKWPHTKGNIPKDHYVLHVENKRYKYDKDDIDYGSGTPHRYRYDVRRHPRVVNDRIVWVNPYQRGSGKYIPKIYTNRKEWFISYLWYQVEKLSKWRVCEIVMIRALATMRNMRKKRVKVLF